MIEFKFAILPLVTLVIFAEQLFSSLPDGIRLVIDIAAICTLAAGFLILGRLRAALGAAESSGDAWKQERDAAVARADRFQREKEEEGKQLLQQITDLKVEITKLQERPTLEVIAAKLDIMNDNLNRGREEAVAAVIQAIEGGRVENE